MQMFVKGISGHETFDVLYYMVILLPFMILLNQVRNLKQLAYASTTANALQMTGMIIIFANLLQDLPPSWSRPAAVTDFAKLPLFFGTAIYSFEGISLILPMKKEMKEPTAFGGRVGVLNTGMTLVTILYMGMGFFGYLKYGPDVKGSITLNLPQTWWNELCRLMFAISIFLSYALQMYVPINLLWPWVVEKFQLDEDHHQTKYYDIAFRAALVTGTCKSLLEISMKSVIIYLYFFIVLIAAAVPKLDLFISLVGALSSSCLALIFPPLIDILTEWDNKETLAGRSRNAFYMKNVLICLFGIIGFLTGTYASVGDIINYFAHPDELPKV